MAVVTGGILLLLLRETRRPQTRAEMVGALIAASKGQYPDSDGESLLRECERIVDQWWNYLHHPLWKRHGHGLDAMGMDQIEKELAELRGTEWEGVWPADPSYGELQMMTGGEWDCFPEVREVSIEWSFGSVSAMVLGAFVMISSPWRRRSTRRVGSCLEFFAEFSMGETGEVLRLCAADLRRHVRGMEERGCGRWHMLAARSWITASSLGAIAWDVAKRVGVRALSVFGLIRAFKSLW